jgi:hypothetical protein
VYTLRDETPAKVLRPCHLLLLRVVSAQGRDGPYSRMVLQRGRELQVLVDMTTILRIRYFSSVYGRRGCAAMNVGGLLGSNKKCPACHEHNKDIQGYSF